MTHTFRSHYFHVVWSTKDRSGLITKDLKPILFTYLGSIIKYNHGELLAAGGTDDHIHLLICLNLPENYTLLIRELKVSSTIWINQHHPCDKRFAWQEGYGSFSLGYSDVKKTKEHIQNQEKHHKQYSFDDEYIKMLEAHEISFDERTALG